MALRRLGLKRLNGVLVLSRPDLRHRGFGHQRGPREIRVSVHADLVVVPAVSSRRFAVPASNTLTRQLTSASGLSLAALLAWPWLLSGLAGLGGQLATHGHSDLGGCPGCQSSEAAAAPTVQFLWLADSATTLHAVC